MELHNPRTMSYQNDIQPRNQWKITEYCQLTLGTNFKQVLIEMLFVLPKVN